MATPYRPFGDDPLFDEALDWVLRLKAGAPTRADLDTFLCWRKQSSAHQQALGAAVRLYRLVGAAAKELAEEEAAGAARQQAAGSMYSDEEGPQVSRISAVFAAISTLVSMPITSAHAAEVTGAGSTFVYPILEKWSAAFAGKTGDTVKYQSIGSGGGLTKIKAATVDFGASDMPLKSDELAKLGMGQFPLVIGGVVPMVNIDGVQSDRIKFTGALLADIFLGKVKKWNDPAIKAINPDLTLPNAGINVVHRLDGSGTTFNWTNYLSKQSAEWRDNVGEGTSVEWPVGVGGKGNEGVAVYVTQSKNSIGYVEYAYAVRYKMPFGLVQNQAGRFVTPNAESFRAAAESADWAAAKDFYLVMTNAPGENAYPVTAASFILMYKKAKDANRTKLALDFFKWALEQGQDQARALDYVPLPPSVVKQIEAYWKVNFDTGI